MIRRDDAGFPMPQYLKDAASAPAALSAFLRGVERRGALLAELQCGDAAHGDIALAAAMRAFRLPAAGLPMAEWPQRFWSLLAAAPQLRQDAAQARWPASLAQLASLPAQPRLALLLRLTAGLGENEAAAAMALDGAAYRRALGEACPRDADGQPDADAWRRLAETIQQRLRELPPERLARLARLREEAIAGTQAGRAAAPLAAGQPRPAPPRPQRKRAWLLALLTLTTLAAAVAWQWPNRYLLFKPNAAAVPATREPAPAPGLRETVEIAVEALPAAAPGATYDAQTALLTHPDLELLLDDAADGLVQQAGFLAWYEAEGEAAQDDAVPGAAVTGQEPTDAPR
ncbi:hypothetical protein [Pseudoxanthomonas wuyuanensis]|uniref:Uncharacterized protein n=1 Tax=Pseudoxanthomonas wuyuanensis TaxID=1073196 RepID=A0A286D895_9GAMM|nr:hypothetical protein [Pseudoxanthomonas wuyuanensis]KAF1720112.1 hypothetical protein CSC75_12200 [Pseudoxanthomonas wuyuanensis]SOD54827.1 hypothetical protein SAMN06296416_10588 [Pseudoxanthomonas wuyuanensis]